MPVRVLHVLPHRGGGAETYIDMLERLEGYEHERFYLASGRRPADAIQSIPLRWPVLAARARRADVLHSHGDVASMIALPLMRVRPAVMTCQGLHLLRRVDGAKRSAVVRGLSAVARASRAVICSSESERDELAAIFRPRDRHKLALIHNGIDVPAPVGDSEREATRSELRVGPETVLGLFTGQLEPRKAPLLAARAAVSAHRAGAPFVLAVAGDGPQAGELLALAGETVTALGFRSDVPRLLDGADVFVHSSEREGMSFALLEAMAHGLAIIASDGSSNPEAIGDAGLLFRAGDEHALAEALVRVSADPELRASLGEKASARAREAFGPRAFLASSEAVYSASLAPHQAHDEQADESTDR